MGYHLTTFFENQDGAGTEQNLAALNDTLSQLFPVVAGDYLRASDKFRWISGAYTALDATVYPRARVSSEGIKKIYGGTGVNLPEINSGAKPRSPPNFNDFRQAPIPTEVGENIEVQTVNNPAAAANQYAVLIMSDGKISPVDPAGGVWVRATAAATAKTASVWNSRALTFDNPLRVGYYDVLHYFHVTSAGNSIASRMAFDGQVNKPGFLSQNAVTDLPHQSMRTPGQWGVIGRFHSNNPPNLEVLPDAADNILDDVRMYVRFAGA